MGSLRAAARAQKAGEARPRANAESCSYGSSHYSQRFVARRKIPRVLGHVICLPRPYACNSHLHPTPAPISYQDAMHLFGSGIWLSLVLVGCGIWVLLAGHVADASPCTLPMNLSGSTYMRMSPLCTYMRMSPLCTYMRMSPLHVHAHVISALLSTCLCSA